MKKWMKYYSGLLAVLMLALSIAGCGGTDGKKEESGAPADQGQQQEEPQTDVENSKTVYPLTVKDDTGTELTLEKAPAKLVSLSPSETEKLFALGLDEEIVGVSEVDDYPEAAKSKPKMGGYEMDVEAILASGADVVFTAAMNEQNVQKLRDLGVKLFVNDPKTIAEVMDNILLVGQITDRQNEAKAVVEQMQKDLDTVREAVKSVKDEDKKKVYVEFSPGWTVGKGTYLDEMLNLSNAVNVAADTEGWFEISEEKIIDANPEVILYSSNVLDAGGNKSLDQVIKERSGWDQIEAVKNNKLIKVDDNLISRPGPRVTKGLLEVAGAIYPELMKP